MDILNKIIENRKHQVELAKKNKPIAQLQDMIKEINSQSDTQSFYDSMNNKNLSIIAEVKKASPSKGIICKDFDYSQIALDYFSGGADAISVLTEETYFQGNLDYLDKISIKTPLPTLRKDFIFEEYQVYEAAAFGAKAFLLIAAALSDQQLVGLLDLGKELNLDALVEIHNKNELLRVLQTDAQIIGVNNRDLKTFNVSFETSIELAEQIPGHIVKISESGINSREDIIELEQAGFHAALIGESLMRQKDRVAYLNYLRGNNVG